MATRRNHPRRRRSKRPVRSRRYPRRPRRRRRRYKTHRRRSGGVKQTPSKHQLAYAEAFRRRGSTAPPTFARHTMNRSRTGLPPAGASTPHAAPAHAQRIQQAVTRAIHERDRAAADAASRLRQAEAGAKRLSARGRQPKKVFASGPSAATSADRTAAQEVERQRKERIAAAKKGSK